MIVLIAEKGTDWSSWLEGCREKGMNVAAVIQSPFEATGDFATRARRCLATLAEKGDAPERTVLVGTPDSDALHALAGVVKDQGRVEVVVSPRPSRDTLHRVLDAVRVPDLA